MNLKRNLDSILTWKTINLLILSWSISIAAKAQIEAPNLYCIQGDTLRWDVPNVTCGPVTSYNIYYATIQSGPFTLLTSIIDPSQTAYVFNNSPGGNIYYYMTTTANCPGMSSLSSDTLDTQALDEVNIISVNVIGPDIQIIWEPSNSPESYGYIIYRIDDNNQLVILDTVTTLSYIDSGLDTDIKSYEYFVTAMDRCGTNSIFTAKHQSILLVGTSDTCARTIKLTFNEYSGWPGGVIEYRVFASINGGPEQFLGATAGTVFDINDVIDQAEYVIRVEAVGNQSVKSASSNKIKIRTKSTNSLRLLCIYGLDLSDEDRAKVQFGSDPSQFIGNFVISSANEISALTSPSNQLNTTILGDQAMGSGISSSLSYFSLQFLDDCDHLITSNVVQGIQLNALLREDQSILFNWNEPYWENGDITNYRLYRLDVNNPTNPGQLIFEGIPSTLNYIDEESAVHSNGTKICFVLKADVQTICDGVLNNGEVVSNQVCVDKTAYFHAPNAFSPSGINRVFSPVIVFKESIQSYQMTIYNRFGQQVFTTNDPESGWTGQNGSQHEPSDVYTWHISITSINGVTREGTGAVFLIR